MLIANNDLDNLQVSAAGTAACRGSRVHGSDGISLILVFSFCSDDSDSGF